MRSRGAWGPTSGMKGVTEGSNGTTASDTREQISFVGRMGSLYVRTHPWENYRRARRWLGISDKDARASGSKSRFPGLMPSLVFSCSFGCRKCFQEEFQQVPQ